MILENKIIFFPFNILAISVIVAILEIVIEKDAGWGANLPKDKWYGKIIGKDNPVFKNMAKIIGVPYFFGYGVLMYFFLIPIILVFEYSFTEYNLLFFMAIYVAATALEDFLWFVFNWNFNSLAELVKGPNGKIWWHQKWFKIWHDKFLPRSYFIAIILATLLLFLSVLTNGK
jgi:hypothetical protein